MTGRLPRCKTPENACDDTVDGEFVTICVNNSLRMIRRAASKGRRTKTIMHNTNIVWDPVGFLLIYKPINGLTTIYRYRARVLDVVENNFVLQ